MAEMAKGARPSYHHAPDHINVAFEGAVTCRRANMQTAWSLSTCIWALPCHAWLLPG